MRVGVADTTFARINMGAVAIDELTGELRPAVERALLKHGIPTSRILVNVGDDKLTTNDDIREFNRLDTVSSEKQFILLVNKGREGWNCRSLFGVGLFREPKSKVFVLQATMRCLRAIGQAQHTGHVFLSDDNLNTLNDELQQNFRISAEELQKTASNRERVEVRVVEPPVKIKLVRVRKQYTLRNAASELLGMEKRDVDPKEIESLWEQGGEGLRRFVSYSRRDAVLAQRMLLDLRLMDKYIALSRASGSLLQDIVNGGQSGMVESLLLRRFQERGRVVPPKPDSDVSEGRYEENEALKGGAVLVPEKGLVEDVIILDYKSLYPTIMMAHNLCYSTVLIRPDSTGESHLVERETGEREVITSPSGGRFVSAQVSPGIMPAILRELLEQRTATKRLMKKAGDDERLFLDAKQYAMKILLNSFYGYSGYARARLYSLALANAVTSFGRENILRTKKIIDDIGSVYVLDGEVIFKDALPFGKAAERCFDLSVVYGDTDSVFVRLQPTGTGTGAVSLNDAELIGRKIAETVTASLPEPMELVFEAFARRGIFLAKKRYALWVFEPMGEAWKDRIKVRGMETVRRDWCDLTSKTLKTCLELVLKEGKVEEAVEHVRAVVLRLKNLDLSRDPEILQDLTLTRRYTKSSGSYKNKQPHIQLVEKIKERGGSVPGVGDRVPFVIVQGKRGKKNRELFVNRAEDPAYALERNMPLDTDYYVEKQILPPVLRIFESFGVGRDSLCTNRGQSSLFSFGPDASKPVKQKSLFDF